MRVGFNGRLSLFAGAAIIALSPLTSFAQESEPAGESDTIVVTATRRALSLQDVPASVSAVSAEKIDELRARDTQDYILTVPGVSFVDSGGGRQSFIFRGISPLGGSATTAVYLDETPLGIDLRLFDVDRVEVLRGPQGTLYGQSSMGGAIRTITRQPNTEEYAFRFDGALTTMEEGEEGWDANFAANLPLVKDKLALRAIYYTEKESGFVDNYEVIRAPGGVTDPATTPATAVRRIGENTGANLVEGGRIALRLEPNEALDITVSYLWQNDDFEGLGSEDTDLGRGALRQGRLVDELYYSDNRQVNLTANLDLGFATLMSSSTYSGIDFGTTRDTTYVYGPAFDPYLPVVLYENYYDYNITQEVRLTSNGDERFDWVVGAYYNKSGRKGLQQLISFGISDVFGPLTPGDSVFDFLPDQFSKELSYYAEGNFELTDRIGLTAGVRRYSVESGYDDTQGGLLAGGVFTSASDGAKEDGFTYKFGADFKVSDDLLIYAQAASGYRGGGPNGFVPPGGNPVIPKEFESDTLWDYELGWRWTGLGDKLVLNGALYYIDWTDVQVALNDDRGYSGTLNAGAAHSKGVELELTVRPVEGLTLDGSLSVGEAQFDEDFQDNIITPINDSLYLKGDQLPNIPETTGSVRARYERPILTSWTGFLQGQYSYVGERTANLRTSTNPENRRRVTMDSYGLIGARIGASKESLEVSLFAENLADERGMIGREANLGYERIQYVPPRTFGVSVKKDF